jgi:hypothetical protein
MKVNASRAVHTCQPPSTGSSPVDNENSSLACHGVHDAKNEMKTLCEEFALAEYSKSSIALADKVLSITAKKYEDLSKFTCKN